MLQILHNSKVQMVQTRHDTALRYVLDGIKLRFAIVPAEEGCVSWTKARGVSAQGVNLSPTRDLDMQLQ